MRHLVSLLSLVLVATQTIAVPPPSHDDAPLRCVQFVDDREGWAAGDDGVIWHSIDGGKTWERQKTGTRASIRAIHFLTPYSGWAVGRREQPGDLGSVGVLLSTNDGGISWLERTVGLLPGLMRVRFEDEKRGVVQGDATAAYPSGTFETTDGGASWRPIARPTDTKPANDTTLPLSAEALAVCDIHCRANVGESWWVAGRMGPNIFRSRDAGKTWQRQQTPVAVPLHGLFMLSESQGWAVGELGTILATTDGGQTWTHRRGSGPKAALLTINAKLNDVPVMALPSVGAKDGYFTASVRVTSADAETADPRRFSEPMMLASAVRLSGGSVGESLTKFPLPNHCEGLSADQLRVYWDSLHEGRGAEQLVRQLTFTIRLWRPDVIVTDSISPTASAAEQLTLAAVQEAFNRADDPTAYPEQLTSLGLTSHAAGKLYGFVDTANEANVTLDAKTFVPEIAESAETMTFTACQLLQSRPVHGFRLIAHRIPDAEKHKQLMDGVTLARGGMARKPDSKPLWQFTDDYVKGRADVTQVRTQLLKAGDQPMTLELRRAIEEQLAILPIHDAIEVVLSLANAARSRGQWTAAREWFSLATDRYPAHPLSAQAYLWQMKFHASSEHQRRLELGTMPFVRPTEFFEIPANIVQQVSGTDGLASPIKARFRSTDAEREWIGTGLNHEAKLFAMQPLITREPSTQILLNATRLRLGLTADAEKIVSTYARMNSDGTPMMTAISREVALATRQPVKPMLVCEKFGSRPVLDGKLDEAMWSDRTAFSHAPARLGAYGTEVKLGYDDEFLYVGVMCTHPIGEHVPVAETRKYDDDVSPFDRVEIVFDADRDYATYQRFRVDQRGCTAEDLCGDPTWNPKWFVAGTTAPTSWTAEIAIPLSELTTRKPSDRHVWAANVVRVLPGRGVTSLTAPADATPRLEGLGLLEFRAR